MDSKIKKLIELGVIVCGRIKKEYGIVVFERVDPSELGSVPEEERAYATSSMGRAIFTIDKSGTIHNIKGVDSHLKMEELAPIELMNAKAIEFSPNPGGYKVSAMVFHGLAPEIRINGTSPLEDVEIEGDINGRLAEFGVKVPKIKYIREIPREFSIKYGLPIKRKGSLEELKSDYAKEDDERKQRLKVKYGETYSQDIADDERPETLKEYLQRIGFLDSPEIVQSIESLGYSIQRFTESVDHSYSRGQRYGQMERMMDSPFRISDLEILIKEGDIEKLKAIMEFAEQKDPEFAEALARTYGKNIALLMNNGWGCENLFHKQDFSLGGEFCDDAYYDIAEREKEIREKYKEKPYVVEALVSEMRHKYFCQTLNIAACIKVVQTAMLMTGKEPEKVEAILDAFIDSFVENIDIERVSAFLKLDENALAKIYNEAMDEKQDWASKMAVLYREDGIKKDEAIYKSHVNNNDFYRMVIKRIFVKIKERQMKLQNNRGTKSLPEVKEAVDQHYQINPKEDSKDDIS